MSARGVAPIRGVPGAEAATSSSAPPPGGVLLPEIVPEKAETARQAGRGGAGRAGAQPRGRQGHRRRLAAVSRANRFSLHSRDGDGWRAGRHRPEESRLGRPRRGARGEEGRWLAPLTNSVSTRSERPASSSSASCKRGRGSNQEGACITHAAISALRQAVHEQQGAGGRAALSPTNYGNALTVAAGLAAEPMPDALTHATLGEDARTRAAKAANTRPEQEAAAAGAAPQP